MWNTKKFIKSYFLIIALIFILLILAGSYFGSAQTKEKEGLASYTTTKPVTTIKPILTTAKPVTTIKPTLTTAKPVTTTASPAKKVTFAPILTTVAPIYINNNPDPLQNLKNILQGVGPYPDPKEFDRYRSTNPCKILENLKPIGKAPAPSKTLPPAPPVASFQVVINELVAACITAEKENESSSYMKVSKLTTGYTMYLKIIRDNLQAVNKNNPENVRQLSHILRNNLLTYKENNSTYYIPLDVIITYINSHLNYLINSGVYNPTDTPEFICNFNNLSVAQYGYIQNFTTEILTYIAAVVDIKVPLENATREKITSDMPRSVLLVQTLNNNDIKNIKI